MRVAANFEDHATRASRLVGWRLGMLFVVVLSQNAWGQSFLSSYRNVRFTGQDEAFVNELQERADVWTRRTDAAVFDERAQRLGVPKRTARDTAVLSPSGSWRLSICHNPAFDTLVILGLSRNYNYERGMLSRGDGIRWISDPEEAPRYTLPLSEYHQFMTAGEAERLARLIEKCIIGLADNHYMIGAYPVVSFSWRMSDHQDWAILDGWNMRSAFSLCALTEGVPVFTDPSRSSRVLSSELRNIMEVVDTNVVLPPGVAPPRLVARVTELEFSLEPAVLNWQYDYNGWPGFLAYSVKCETLGVRFEGQPYSTAWLGRLDFTRCTHMGFLGEFLDAILANRLHQQLVN